MLGLTFLEKGNTVESRIIVLVRKGELFYHIKSPLSKRLTVIVKFFTFIFLAASSAGKAAETKTNDILAMISPEGERVGLSKVRKMFAFVRRPYINFSLRAAQQCKQFFFLNSCFPAGIS